MSADSSSRNRFLQLQQELDSKHDRYDKLAKLSRECTSHSKKIIFHIHRTYFCPTEGREAAEVLEDTEKKFAIVSGILKEMATELATANEDPFRYHGAYTQGVQEFIEALGYWTFCRTGKLLTTTQAESWLSFRFEEEEPKVVLLLSPTDFVLGIADLTGELMRACVDAVTRGNRVLPFTLLPFMRALYCEFLKLPPIGKGLSKKVEVLEGSLLKVEHVCYTLTVRGSETHSRQLLYNLVNEEPPNLNTDS